MYDACSDPVYATALATIILEGGAQAEELVEVQGGRESRTPTVVVTGGGTRGAEIPAVEGVQGLSCSTDGVQTVINALGVELVMRRVVDPSVRTSCENSLTGTWAGQEEPGAGDGATNLTHRGPTTLPPAPGARSVERRERGSVMTNVEFDRDSELREQAINHLKKRRDFHGHLLVYVLVNTFLVVIWAVTSLDAFFWPIFPIVGWGIGVVMNAWDVYFHEDFSEEEIHREITHMDHRR